MPSATLLCAMRGCVCSRLEHWGGGVVTMCQRWGVIRWALALLLGVGAAAAQAAPPACALQQFPLESVLPGIRVAHGDWPAKAGHGRVATTVVLGQGRQVTVVDPGPARQVGRALQSTLQCQQSRVTGLINTHAHAEQVLANSAFAVPVASTHGTARAMTKRCPDCKAAMVSELGARAMQGTRIVLPQQSLQDGQVLDLGGRRWQVMDMPHAHTESDLVLWSPHEKIAIVGGLVDGRWPVLAQGSVMGWLQALSQLQTLSPDWLVGQHVVRGPGQVQAVLLRQHRYLCGLAEHAWRSLERGLSEAEGVQALALPAEWPQATVQQAPEWQRQHVFNQLRAWREIEPLWMARKPWPALCGSAPDVGG